MKDLENVILDVLKTINIKNLNPKYLNEIFHKPTQLTHRLLNLQVNKNSDSNNTTGCTTGCSIKSIRTIRPHISANFPDRIKKDFRSSVTNHSSN